MMSFRSPFKSVAFLSVVSGVLLASADAGALGYFPFGCSRPIHVTRNAAQGSPLTGAITIVPVYIGGVTAGYESATRAFYAALNSTNYLGWLGAQYGAGSIAGPSKYDFYVTPHTFTTAKNPLAQGDIAGELYWQLTNTGAKGAAGLPAGDLAHTIYAVHVAFPYTAAYGGQVMCQPGAGGAPGGYHQSFSYSAGSVVYTVIPDYSDPSTGCYNPASHGGATGAQTIAESHEIAEALTRPSGGWFSAATCGSVTNAEIGDICVGSNAAFTTAAGAQWWAQTFWSNVANGCICPVGNGSACGSPGASGDVNGDGRADIALVGSTGNPDGPYIPVATGTSAGTWNLLDYGVDDPDFLTWSQHSSAVMGDFDNDGLFDIALTGGGGWRSIPVGRSHGSVGAEFAVTNHIGVSGSNSWPSNIDFPTFSTQTSFAPVAGDFDGDGYSDIALAGGSGWNSVPIAYGDGNGAFASTNNASSGAAWLNIAMSANPGGQLLSGDFNGDGFSDLAYIVSGNIVVATSPYQGSGGRTGTFTASIQSVYDFFGNQSPFTTQWAPGALAVTGDFNADGCTDVALTGGQGWSTIPIAYSVSGAFVAVNPSDTGMSPTFSYFASAQHIKVVVGDWTGYGFPSLAITGVPNWTTLPMSLPPSFWGSLNNWQWYDVDPSIANFPSLATQTSAHAVSTSQAWR